MYLKKVTMENFKSFGKKMEVPLKKGYTNITGPNGSGKSNIGDAILFVLGPKSSKEIRAGRLTDLIFNGGKKGKPADRCKVSLVFENEDRALPRNSDEVTFTRKVQRSNNDMGYNSYFYINGRSSSLTEFQELMSHAGISPDGYNIVQQGDIARIVEMSDYERRKILDHISGISDYDDEIEKAEKKKEKVNQDLDRISILLKEIDTQVKELEEDRKEALKFQELSDKVSEAKKMKAWKTKGEVEKTIQSMQEEVDKSRGRCEKIDEEKKEIKEKIKAINKELDELEDEIDSKGGKKNKELMDELNQLRLKVGRAQDKIEDYNREIDDSKKSRKIYKDKISELKEEKASLQEEISGSKEEVEKTNKKLKEVQDEADEVREKQSESDDRINELRKDGLEVKKKFDEKSDKLSDMKVELDRKKDKLDRVIEDISEKEEEIEGFQFEMKENDWKLKERKKKSSSRESQLEELKEKFHKERNKEKSLRKDKDDLESRLNRLEREYNQLKAQEEAAKSVKRGYNRAVQKILEARDKGDIKGIHGTIAELADVDKEYETALQVAAGGRMQSIVVDDDGVASKAIKLLKKDKAGRATFLPINKMMSGRPRGKALRAVKNENAVDFALDLVKYDNQYENVFWYVFQDTVVMNDIDSARKLMGGVRMVTLDGEKIGRSGAMVGGTLNKNMLSFQAPDRGKLDKVGLELKSTRDNLDKVVEQLKEAEKNIQELQDDIREIQTDGTEGYAGLEADVKGLKKKIQKRKKELEEKNKEKKKIEEKIGKLETKVSNLEEKREELKAERDEISEKIRRISPQELSKKLTELNDREVELNKKFNELNSQNELKVEKLERIEKDIQELKDERKKLKKTISDRGSDIKKKQKVIENNSKELKERSKKVNSMDEELQSLRDERDNKRDEMKELEHKIDTLDTEKTAKITFIKNQKEKIGQHMEELQELENEVGEGKGISEKDIPSMKELKHIISRGEAQMENLKPVNMRAIEDYKEKKKRKEKLQKEYTELEDRKEDLDALIDEIDGKKKDGLMGVKKEINENFKEVYKELSGGGDAHMEIENPESPFEGGLIVKARPPGKKVHRIQALSGGEKGVVSMAFIFAIQKYDPSPFYLLDEIDQNLDGVNAENVAEMISKNSNFAQFIQVSLRKATLKKSDHIIGVTIHDNGVSDIIMKVNMGADAKKKDIPELSQVSKLNPEVD